MAWQGLYIDCYIYPVHPSHRIFPPRRLLFFQMLNLTHDWLRSFLPHVLTKIDRVGFGLLTPADLQRALEVSCSTTRPGRPCQCLAYYCPLRNSGSNLIECPGDDVFHSVVSFRGVLALGSSIILSFYSMGKFFTLFHDHGVDLISIGILASVITSPSLSSMYGGFGRCGVCCSPGYTVVFSCFLAFTLAYLLVV